MIIILSSCFTIKNHHKSRIGGGVGLALKQKNYFLNKRKFRAWGKNVGLGKTEAAMKCEVCWRFLLGEAAKRQAGVPFLGCGGNRSELPCSGISPPSRADWAGICSSACVWFIVSPFGSHCSVGRWMTQFFSSPPPEICAATILKFLLCP